MRRTRSFATSGVFDHWRPPFTDSIGFQEKKPGPRPGLFVESCERGSAQDAADDAAHEAAHGGRIGTAAAVLARCGSRLATTATAVGATARRGLVFVVAARRSGLGRDDFRQQ